MRSFRSHLWATWFLTAQQSQHPISSFRKIGTFFLCTCTIASVPHLKCFGQKEWQRSENIATLRGWVVGRGSGGRRQGRGLAPQGCPRGQRGSRAWLCWAGTAAALGGTGHCVAGAAPCCCRSSTPSVLPAAFGLRHGWRLWGVRNCHHLRAALAVGSLRATSSLARCQRTEFALVNEEYWGLASPLHFWNICCFFSTDGSSSEPFLWR